MIYLLQNSYFWRKNSKFFLDDNSYLISYRLILTKTHNTKKSIKRILQITSKSHDGTNWTNWMEDFSLLYSAWHSWLNWRLDSSTTEKFFYLACAPKKEAAARAQVKRLKLSQILCPIEIVFEKFQSLQKWSSHLGATFLNRTLIPPIWQKVWTSICCWQSS